MATRATHIWKTASDAILGRPELKPREVSSLAGVPAEQGGRFWQALGFPSVATNEAAFTQRDVEALGLVARLIEGDGPDHDVLLQMARATGQALSRVAHMHVLSVAEAIDAVARDETLTNNEAADRIADIAETLVRHHEPSLGYIWRRHVLAAISHVVAGAVTPGEEAEGAVVGFADLVDFTATAQQLKDHELADIVEHFERIIYQEIPDRGGRVVKTLGDEVMFTNPSPHAAAETALAIAAACRQDDVLPEVRGGMAFGTMLAWEGDVYGPTVNLAHRLVGVARPGTVIVGADLAQRLEDDEAFTLVEIRDVKLKGIGRTKPFVLRAREHGKR